MRVNVARTRNSAIIKLSFINQKKEEMLCIKTGKRFL